MKLLKNTLYISTIIFLTPYAANAVSTVIKTQLESSRDKTQESINELEAALATTEKAKDELNTIMATVLKRDIDPSDHMNALNRVASYFDIVTSKLQAALFIAKKALSHTDKASSDMGELHDMLATTTQQDDDLVKHDPLFLD